MWKCVTVWREVNEVKVYRERAYASMVICIMRIHVGLRTEDANFNPNRGTVTCTLTCMSFVCKESPLLKAAGRQCNRSTCTCNAADVITDDLTRRGTPCFIKISGLNGFIYFLILFSFTTDWDIQIGLSRLTIKNMRPAQRSRMRYYQIIVLFYPPPV